MPFHKGRWHMNKAEFFIRQLKENRILMVASAAVLIISAAAVLFYVNGNSNTISIEKAEKEVAEEKIQETDEEKETVYVDVSGCVKDPGVYKVPEGSRVFEVIEKAGGLTENADTSGINQAEPVSDGLKITVPDRDTALAEKGAAETDGMTEGVKVNINTADSEALQKIPGIGPVTAGKIIMYREQNGRFGSVEDIMNVSGIGEKTFEKIKSEITT